MSAELKDRCRDMKQNGVHDDHDQCPSQYLATVDDEMQARPEDHGLAGDHAPPAYNLECDREITGEDFKNEQRIAQCKGNDADRGYDQAPKIASRISFKGCETQDDKFDRITPCDGDERRHDTFQSNLATGLAAKGIIVTGL
ncbi:unnamed protein product [Aspergillus oryzae]|uniref:Unnamed protein product n=2 Tax=Aspergillus oryzae TaxID=5062 RepID=A0AAN4YU90_ASPOZ|nr:unnamed protein product [Aspergillus oryzae]GMF95423.1 unnamed protein product [Aspergillus oryzae]GMG11411.1 unnamed protein product [Aspergillus oryzae]GMG35393.1 unnamed protein product [Aspergillus oryzae]GMG48694.1 unnamed protein product [Aspergillus oryzae var. brunneus]